MNDKVAVLLLFGLVVVSLAGTTFLVYLHRHDPSRPRNWILRTFAVSAVLIEVFILWTAPWTAYRLATGESSPAYVPAITTALLVAMALLPVYWVYQFLVNTGRIVPWSDRG